MQHPSDVAAVPIDITGSAGACQRFTSHLQLQLSTVTVLLAAAWALLLHAAHSVLACLASGFSNQAAAAKSHLLLLKSASPSRLYRTAAAKAIAATPAAQREVSAQAVPSTEAVVRRRHVQDSTQHLVEQPRTCANGSRSMLSTGCRTAAVAAGSGLVARIPMQLQEHRGRLTVALDLDETLLCTYRIERCAGHGDSLQLVPSNRPGVAPVVGNSSSIFGSSGGMSWPALLGLGSSSNNSSSPASSSMGSYSISKRCAGATSELGGAARATAWMHYTPPPPSARSSCSGSAGCDIGSSASAHQQQPGSPHNNLPGPHSLAIFERPGCREFLAQLSSFAELVLFTAAAPGYAGPLADMLDPSGAFFRGRLYSDACVSHSGRRGVKDLSCLGRDVRRVVLVDNCLFSFLAQPRNGLPCLPFHGATGDSQLLAVILPLLRSLSQVGGDIRPLLDNMFRVRHWLASKGYHTPDEA